MDLLDDLTSGDAHRIWSAAGRIRHLRDMAALTHLADHIATIRARTRDIDLGGALRPNASHLRFALRKLAFVRDGAGCLCTLYPADDFYDPAREAEAGWVRILETAPRPGGWGERLICACTSCGMRYQVEDEEYHYRWWRWQPIE
ncbi:hypothetical protein [Luteimonas sp. FCS-9]|uniref:hypothetical protein n=1 Tax=Luteimonas sp. FCS-9 TaxID=1547516 RepID=UPI00063E8870|nr:hypothetical protein [Luteimonas sp. FCS-9]KLJ02558.1 hypothetical protein WQ56_01905 [Luteimonas sp. FCS-9]